MPLWIGKYIFRFWTSSRLLPFEVAIGSGLVCMRDTLCDVNPAGGDVRRANGFERRVLFQAALHGVGAAGREWAAGRSVDQIGRQPLDGNKALLARLIDAR